MEIQRRAPYLATDILTAPDDGFRYEVIDGDLYVTAAPVPAHQRAVQRLSTQLDVQRLSTQLDVQRLSTQLDVQRLSTQLDVQRLSTQLDVQRLSTQLDVYVVANELGLVFSAPIAVLLDSRNGVEPDIVHIRPERRAIIGDRAIEGAPDLVVEVLSPRTEAFDRGLKLRRYVHTGVPHYWLVDVERRRLEPYQLTQGNYVLLATLAGDEVFAPALFPGLRIPLASLWL